MPLYFTEMWNAESQQTSSVSGQYFMQIRLLHCWLSSGDHVFTDVRFEMAAHLVVPLALRGHRQSHAALPLGARGLLPGAVPVEEAHWQAVDVHVLALLHNVCHPDPEVPGSRSAPLGVVPQLIVFQQVPRRGQGSSLSDAVLVCLMVVFGLLTGQVTFSVCFDATKTDWKQIPLSIFINQY